jgi:hypothetical protein
MIVQLKKWEKIKKSLNEDYKWLLLEELDDLFSDIYWIQNKLILEEDFILEYIKIKRLLYSTDYYYNLWSDDNSNIFNFIKSILKEDLEEIITKYL